MKAIKTTLLALLTTSLYSQKQSAAFVNSGAMSRNLSCGIGEIFITPPRAEKKQPQPDENLEIKYVKFLNLIATPNPTSGMVYINADNEIKKAAIYSSEGRWIKDVDLSREKKIDLTDLPSGLYTFVFSEPNYKPIKIIKK